MGIGTKGGDHIGAVVLLFLVSCMMLDLKDRRIPNDYLVINAVILAGYGLMTEISKLSGSHDTVNVFLGHLEGLLILFPAVLLMHVMHLFGGADLKVFLLLAFIHPVRILLMLFAVSVFLGALGGLSFLLITNRLGELLGNYLDMLRALRKGENVFRGRERFHRFPYLSAITGAYLCLLLFGVIR